ncbi:MAG: hypothetical protein ACM3SY_22030 [Candidatus Omnitrophota bacterium]
MKRVIKIIIGLLGLLAAYVVFNQFDSGPARLEVGEPLDTSSMQVLLTGVFKPVSFEKSNGFYRLWTLTEAPEVDIESDAVITKYRRMHDPQFDNAKYINEWHDSGNDWQVEKKKNEIKRGNYTRYFVEWKKIIGDDVKWMDFPVQYMDDWCGTLKEKKQTILQLTKAYRLLSARYQKILDCEQVEEFTMVAKGDTLLTDTPLPNLLALLHLAKLHLTSNMLDATEGNWNQGTANILAQIKFGKKLVKTSRTLMVNLIGKALIRMSLYGLVSVMNQKDCPRDVFEQILNGLPPIEQDEFGNSKQLLAEGFAVIQETKKKGGLFYQMNRTQQYYYDLFAKLYLADKTLPYRWNEHPLKSDSVKSGWFWWLQNPGGKIEFQRCLDSNVPKNLLVASFKGYAVKSFYDLTKISAELHLHYTPNRPVQDILNGLTTYRTLPDPCSGKTYIWKDDRQILYGIGMDRTDNGGGESTRWMQIDGVDYTIPVVLF